MAQNERKAEEGRGRAATAGAESGRSDDVTRDVPGREVTGEEVAISNEWAQRRLELYDRMERAIREEISHALRLATEIRADVEDDADAYLRRLAEERSRLTAEVASLKRAREQAEGELETRRREIDAELETHRREQEADLAQQRQEVEEALQLQRSTTEEELTQLRSTTQAEIDRMVRDAEARRVQVAGEVRALEEQVAQIQGVIDSFLDTQLQTLRGSLGVSRTRAGTRAVADVAGLAGLAARRTPAPAAGTAAVSTAAGAPEGMPELADELGGEVEGAQDEGEELEGVGVMTAGVATEADEAPGEGRTSVVISGVPHFSRARALWQAIQEVPGVREAKALNYQGGVLALEVEHEPAVDLPAHFATLTGLRLRVTEVSPGRLLLSAVG